MTALGLQPEWFFRGFEQWEWRNRELLPLISEHRRRPEPAAIAGVRLVQA
jgi:hypothetical protein